MRMQAVWNGAVVAESERTVRVEGNDYFPADAVAWEHLRPSRMVSICPWKGLASYHHVVVDGEVLRNAAWEYRRPFPWARRVRRKVAFWGGVAVRPADEE